ncbi:MAG: hypothetical protein ACI8TX_003165 [Hyphomicrobiaceae bacterium]|jgi:hypothetical protein
MNELIRHGLDSLVVRRALTVAVVVGTALNLINNYEVFLGVRPSAKVVAQMGLTYVVPYLVSTHGQVTGARELDSALPMTR